MHDSHITHIIYGVLAILSFMMGYLLPDIARRIAGKKKEED